ncbi:hypothetical protein BC835DRAFT_993544 [Cytidiella melzeri]|nr:hypothetical protein BC835DRAFT_993544 [Cytidiella melzeri]
MYIRPMLSMSGLAVLRIAVVVTAVCDRKIVAFKHTTQLKKTQKALRAPHDIAKLSGRLSEDMSNCGDKCMLSRSPSKRN